MTAPEVLDPDEVVKEMFDARFPRVDAVRGPAHRMPFVVLKALQPGAPDATGDVADATAACSSLTQALAMVQQLQDAQSDPASQQRLAAIAGDLKAALDVLWEFTASDDDHAAVVAKGESPLERHQRLHGTSKPPQEAARGESPNERHARLLAERRARGG